MKTHVIKLMSVQQALRYGGGNAMRTKAFDAASRLMYGTDKDRREADLVELVRQAVDAGTRCGIYSMNAVAFSKEV